MSDLKRKCKPGSQLRFLCLIQPRFWENQIKSDRVSLHLFLLFFAMSLQQKEQLEKTSIEDDIHDLEETEDVRSSLLK